MALIYLIRHAQTERRPGVPAALWPLSVTGHGQAEALAVRSFWRDVAMIYASPEDKAMATISPAAARYGIPVVTLQDLRELERPDGEELTQAEYTSAVASCFADPSASVGGWEPAGRAQRRVFTAIESVAADLARQSAGGPSRTAAVVSHGLALALFVASLTGRAAPSVAEWRSLPMPGLAVLDSETWQLVKPFAPIDQA